MENKSLKALSIQRLQGNQQGNHKETRGVYQGNFEETRKGNFDLDQMEKEYFEYLARFWFLDDDPGATMDEARRVVDRLDVLFQALRSNGRNPPVRLPVERKKVA
jgi:hypothetical protein